MSWTKLETVQDVAVALTRGDVIEVCPSAEDYEESYIPWEGYHWNADFTYRARSKELRKKIILREALMCFDDEYYFTRWTSENPPLVVDGEVFVKWIPGTAKRIFIVEQ